MANGYPQSGYRGGFQGSGAFADTLSGPKGGSSAFTALIKQRRTSEFEKIIKSRPYGASAGYLPKGRVAAWYNQDAAIKRAVHGQRRNAARRAAWARNNRTAWAAAAIAYMVYKNQPTEVFPGGDSVIPDGMMEEGTIFDCEDIASIVEPGPTPGFYYTWRNTWLAVVGKPAENMYNVGWHQSDNPTEPEGRWGIENVDPLDDDEAMEVWRFKWKNGEGWWIYYIRRLFTTGEAPTWSVPLLAPPPDFAPGVEQLPGAWGNPSFVPRTMIGPMARVLAVVSPDPYLQPDVEVAPEPQPAPSVEVTASSGGQPPTVGPGPTHKFSVPPPGTKENKSGTLMDEAFGAIGKLLGGVSGKSLRYGLGAASELLDLVDAVYYSIPEERRGRYDNTIYEKLQRILANVHAIDSDVLIKNLVIMEVTDRVSGRVAQGAKKATGATTLFGGAL